MCVSGSDELSGSTSAGELVRETSARSTPASSSTFRCAGCTPYSVAPIDRTSQHVGLHYHVVLHHLATQVALSCNTGGTVLQQVALSLAHLARTVRDELPRLQVVGYIAAVPAAAAHRSLSRCVMDWSTGPSAAQPTAHAPMQSSLLRFNSIRRTDRCAKSKAAASLAAHRAVLIV